MIWSCRTILTLGGTINGSSSALKTFPKGQLSSLTSSICLKDFLSLISEWNLQYFQWCGLRGGKSGGSETALKSTTGKIHKSKRKTTIFLILLFLLSTSLTTMEILCTSVTQFPILSPISALLFLQNWQSPAVARRWGSRVWARPLEAMKLVWLNWRTQKVEMTRKQFGF